MNKNIASDEIIYWTPYNRSEIICGRFNINEWHLVVFDVDSDTSFANAIEASDNIKVYILKRHIDDESIAFLYTKIENKKNQSFPYMVEVGVNLCIYPYYIIEVLLL